MLKKVEAIIQPHRLNDVTSALKTIGTEGMTISDVNGSGRQQGHTSIYRGHEYVIDLLPKVKVEVCVSGHLAKEVALTIIHAARSGRIGDGKIFITPVEEAIRIRNSERGEAAIS